MPGKLVKESAVKDHVYVVFPNDLNPQGTIYGGRVMELIDNLAGIVARRHSGRVCRTASVDSLTFLRPAKLGELLLFKAAVNKAWNTSCEVGVRVFVEDIETKKRFPVSSAYLTFVAVDENGNPVSMPKIIPRTSAEKRRSKEAEKRREIRLALRKK